MKQDKLRDYKLTASVHTLAVKSPGIVMDVPEDISRCLISSTRNKNGLQTTTIINPNKLNGDVFSYDEFETTLDTILAGAGIEEYEIVRADMRFDNYDPEHYQRYAKLNRLLISGLAVVYKVTNAYRSTNLFSQKQLSVAIKNRYFECENYDKNAESNGTDIAQSRLEERSKYWNNKDLRSEFSVTWIKRWRKMLANLDKVYQRYNDELEKLYIEGKNSYPTQFRSLTDFLIQYQDCIFCKEQMIDLLRRFPDEIENPVTRAKTYKRDYGIEYFSPNDVIRAVQEIERATREFFGLE